MRTLRKMFRHDHQGQGGHGHAHGHGHGAYRRADMYGLAHHPGAYDRTSGRIGGPIYRRIAAQVAAAGLPDGAVVLDVGTGPGRLPRRIAARAPGLRVTGVDLAPEMIAFAEEAAEREGLADRVRFTTADSADLPFDDASVDLVVSSMSLHHWDDPAGGLREIVRVLRPGGQAWIYDLNVVLGGAEEQARATTASAVHRDGRLPGLLRLFPLGRLVVVR